MLTSKLENEEESKQRLEREVESYSSRLAAASRDRDQGQTSQRDLELAFQRAEDKMKSHMANLKGKAETFSQQLSIAESKLNKLKIKLQHMRDDLREKTLMLERVQRDRSQTEGQKQEIEHMYQNECAKVNTYLGKQESLEKRLSQLQSENVLLRQQLDDARSRADSREKTAMSRECVSTKKRKQKQKSNGSWTRSIAREQREAVSFFYFLHPCGAVFLHPDTILRKHGVHQLLKCLVVVKARKPRLKQSRLCSCHLLMPSLHLKPLECLLEDLQMGQMCVVTYFCKQKNKIYRVERKNT
ncbi:hypothetical protein CapIbe_012416 [Capra ibex]